MRSATLEGVHILFTSVIPLGMRPETHDTWKTATAFGAQCHTELSSRITHVVTNQVHVAPSVSVNSPISPIFHQAGTQKVDAARRYPSIKIVWLNWLHDSIALWQRQDETPYLLEPRPGMGSGAALASPPSDPHQISSDPEPDADDWDEGGALGVEAAEGDFEFGEFSWDKMNDEVEAAMNESDDEGGSPGGGGAGGSGRSRSGVGGTEGSCWGWWLGGVEGVPRMCARGGTSGRGRAGEGRGGGVVAGSLDRCARFRFVLGGGGCRFLMICAATYN